MFICTGNNYTDYMDSYRPQCLLSEKAVKLNDSVTPSYLITMYNQIHSMYMFMISLGVASIIINDNPCSDAFQLLKADYTLEFG